MSLKAVISGIIDGVIGRNTNNTGTYAQHLYNQQFHYLNAFNDSGEPVTVERGSQIAAVFTCVNNICQDIAQLDFEVRQDGEKGKRVLKNATYRLINAAPNEYTTAFRFWYSMMWSALTKGRGLAIIQRNGMHEPESLIQIDASQCRKTVQNGQAFYHIGELVLPATDVLDIDMYNGLSPITHNATTMGYRIKQEKFSAKAIGTKPPGFIATEGLTREQGAMLAKDVQGAIASGGIPVIASKGATKWNSQMITPDEAQYIGTKRLSNQEIYGIYRMPPTYGQDYTETPYGNAEQQTLVYVKHTLMPWLVLIEEECDSKLFKESNAKKTFPLFTKFNVDGLLRGDTETRFKLYSLQAQSGLYSADEIREKEGDAPQEGGVGKDYYQNGTMVKKGTKPKEELKRNGISREIEELLQ